MRQKHMRGSSSGVKKERTSASAAATSTSHGKKSLDKEEHAETESSYINNETERSNAETNEVDNSPIQDMQRTEETKGEPQISLRQISEIEIQVDDNQQDQSSEEEDQFVQRPFGSWEQTKADDIEDYLVGQQRKYVKYRLNIFVLNRCVLRIQHKYFKMKQLREDRYLREVEEKRLIEEAEAQAREAERLRLEQAMLRLQEQEAEKERRRLQLIEAEAQARYLQECLEKERERLQGLEKERERQMIEEEERKRMSTQKVNLQRITQGQITATNKSSQKISNKTSLRQSQSSSPTKKSVEKKAGRAQGGSYMTPTASALAKAQTKSTVALDYKDLTVQQPASQVKQETPEFKIDEVKDCLEQNIAFIPQHDSRLTPQDVYQAEIKLVQPELQQSLSERGEESPDTKTSIRRVGTAQNSVRQVQQRNCESPDTMTSIRRIDTAQTSVNQVQQRNNMSQSRASMASEDVLEAMAEDSEEKPKDTIIQANRPKSSLLAPTAASKTRAALNKEKATQRSSQPAAKRFSAGPKANPVVSKAKAGLSGTKPASSTVQGVAKTGPFNSKNKSSQKNVRNNQPSVKELRSEAGIGQVLASSVFKKEHKEQDEQIDQDEGNAQQETKYDPPTELQIQATTGTDAAEQQSSGYQVQVNTIQEQNAQSMETSPNRIDDRYLKQDEVEKDSIDQRAVSLPTEIYSEYKNTSPAKQPTAQSESEQDDKKQIETENSSKPIETLQKKQVNQTDNSDTRKKQFGSIQKKPAYDHKASIRNSSKSHKKSTQSIVLNKNKTGLKKAQESALTQNKNLKKIEVEVVAEIAQENQNSQENEVEKVTEEQKIQGEETKTQSELVQKVGETLRESVEQQLLEQSIQEQSQKEQSVQESSPQEQSLQESSIKNIYEDSSQIKDQPQEQMVQEQQPSSDLQIVKTQKSDQIGAKSKSKSQVALNTQKQGARNFPLDIQKILSNNPRHEKRAELTPKTDATKKPAIEIKKVYDPQQIQNQKKNRSKSQLSERLLFQTQQKKASQPTTATLAASKSFSRFQERHSRSRAFGQTMTTKKTDKKNLELELTGSVDASQKIELTAEEKEQKLLRQAQSLSRLMKPTAASSLKKRKASQSAERRQSLQIDDNTDNDQDLTPNYNSNQNEVIKNQRSPNNLSQAVAEGEAIQDSTGQNTGRDSIRQQDSKRTHQSTKSASRPQISRRSGISTNSTINTTSSRTFVNKKEVSSQSKPQVERRSRQSVNTPRIISTKSTNQPRKTNNFQTTPRRTLKEQTSNKILNQQGKAQNPSTVKSSVIVLSQSDQQQEGTGSQVIQQNNADVSKEESKDVQQLAPKEELKVVQQLSNKSQKDSLQAGGIVKAPTTEEKVNESSMSITSQKRNTNRKSAKSFHTPGEELHRLTHKPLHSSSHAKETSHSKSVFKGIPHATKERSSERHQFEDDLKHIGQEEKAERKRLIVHQESLAVNLMQDGVKNFQFQPDRRSSSKKAKSPSPSQSQSQEKSKGQSLQKSSQKTLNVIQEQNKELEKKFTEHSNQASEKSHKSAEKNNQPEQDQQQIFSEKQNKNQYPLLESEHNFSPQNQVLSEKQEFADAQMFEERNSQVNEDNHQINQQSDDFEEQKEAPVIDICTNSELTQPTVTATFGKKNSQSITSEQYQDAVTKSDVNSELRKSQIQVSCQPSILETQFKADTKAHLLKCFNEDLGFSKIQRSFRREFKEIKEVLQKNFHILNAIFLFYAGQSHAYPAIALEDFTNFADECDLVKSGIINEKALLKCFNETIVSTNNFKKSGEKSLCRYEFQEILVRIAFTVASGRQQTQGNTSKYTTSQTIQILITEQIVPNAQKVNRTDFRKMLIGDQFISELLNRNNEVLQAAYNYFVHAKKKQVNLEECVALSRQCQLDVPDQILGVVFAESQMTVIDTMRNKERMYQLSYPEFIYFLCKITEVHYANTSYEAEDFYAKFDNLLDELLAPFDMKPQFKYGVQFACDQPELTTDRVIVEDVEQEEILEFKAPPLTSSNMSSVENTGLHQQQKQFPVDPTQQAKPDNIYVDGEIQAWPQPSPIAYPQRQDIIKSQAASSQEHTPDADIVDNITSPEEESDDKVYIINGRNGNDIEMFKPEPAQLSLTKRRSKESRKANSSTALIKKPTLKIHSHLRAGSKASVE